jgi:hypothetical protein
VPQGAELLGVAFELRGHDLLLTYSKYCARPFFDYYRSIRSLPCVLSGRSPS